MNVCLCLTPTTKSQHAPPPLPPCQLPVLSLSTASRALSNPTHPSNTFPPTNAAHTHFTPTRRMLHALCLSMNKLLLSSTLIYAWLVARGPRAELERSIPGNSRSGEFRTLRLSVSQSSQLLLSDLERLIGWFWLNVVFRCPRSVHPASARVGAIFREIAWLR